MRKTLLTVLLIIAVTSVWAQFPNIPQSRVVTDSIHSKVLNAYRTYSVFLPKSYDSQSDKQYPVLYLLHGMLDTNTGWHMRGHVKDVMDQLVDSGEACEMIIVTPNAGGNIYEGVWNGYFNMPGWDYEDFFYTEFLPHIEKTYRIIADKGHRAVSGLSMGGGGSTVYAQRHADMYCACYAMSALMDIPDPNTNPTPGQEKMTFLGISVHERNAIDFVKNADKKTLAQLRTIKWFVDCGDDDFLFDVNIAFFQAMRNAKVPCQLRVRDGGHTWEYWHSALYTALPFVSRSFTK